MAATKYTYSVSGDFPNGAAAPGKLHSEITSAAITIALDYVASTGDVCDIWFKAALSAGEVTILDALVAAHDGVETTQDHPHRAEDDTPITAVNMFPAGVYAQYVGCGDDITNPNPLLQRYGGDRFYKTRSAGVAGTITEEWQYREVVYIGGGRAAFTGETLQDYLQFKIFSPANGAAHQAVTNNPGAGGYDLAEPPWLTGSGITRYEPNGTTEGAWDLALGMTENAYVGFTALSPYPNPFGTGHFDFNPVNNVLSLNQAGTGRYDIYSVELDVVHQAEKMALPLAEACVPPSVLAKPMLPQWHFRLTCEHSGTNDLEVTWFVFCGRYDIS